MQSPVLDHRTSRPGFLDQLELVRVDVSRRLDDLHRSELGQFLTPGPIASLMASMFERLEGDVRLLDPGAGVGNLLAAFLAEAGKRDLRPRSIAVDAFEIDPPMLEVLGRTIAACEVEGRSAGTPFVGRIHKGDFIARGVDLAEGGLFTPGLAKYTHAILNPPYKKLNVDSAARQALRRVGIETSNLYSAFVALAVLLLEEGGELVAITPRSFCNGPYFKPFRELLLREMDLRRIHVFESRKQAFSDDEVLQENVIFHGVKRRQGAHVTVSSNTSSADTMSRTVPFAGIVRPEDPERFIHVVADGLGQRLADVYASFTTSLHDLGMKVSTGKVVDFRAKKHLRFQPEKGAGPLIYPGHFSAGFVEWPKPGRKPNALVDCSETGELWMPGGTYVLVKRFSSKEEKRRIVAAVFDPQRVPHPRLGFENHLNVFHAEGESLDPVVARGLAVFLNSTLVDEFFRQFNGHTQVNATDLRNLKYPPLAALRSLGARVGDTFPTQEQVDDLVEEMLAGKKTSNAGSTSPVRAMKRIAEALDVLKALGLPKAQQNERSALVLLALLDVTAAVPWSKAQAGLKGVTPMMEFMAEHYGKQYAPNTRETIRRETLHQFVQAGFVAENPDEPSRPVNSPRWCYQITPSALEVLRTVGSKAWATRVKEFTEVVGTLKAKYDGDRALVRLPVTFPDGRTLTLSPGGQNALVKLIVEEFCQRFVPGGHVIYVGDTEDKDALFDKAGLGKLGVTVDDHGKMPDVVVHHVEKDWLLLIEAVTSHGPVNPKRHAELKKLFSKARPGLVFVTTFLTRQAMKQYLGDIAWETEVWVADSPDHLIHFNGERFLGPYEAKSGNGFLNEEASKR